MSRFDADIAAGVVDSHFYQFGRTGVRYLDPLVDPVELTAIVLPERSDENDDSSGRVRRRVRQVQISTDTDSDYGGVAEPHESHKLEIDGENWAIESIEYKDGNVAVLTVTRSPVIELAREGYRGNA